MNILSVCSNALFDGSSSDPRDPRVALSPSDLSRSRARGCDAGGVNLKGAPNFQTVALDTDYCTQLPNDVTDGTPRSTSTPLRPVGYVVR